MKAIIFDMDGVLVNTEPLHYECWKAALADEGVDMSYEVYKPCIGSTVRHPPQDTILAGYSMRWRFASTLSAIPAVKKWNIPSLPPIPSCALWKN